MTAKTTLALAAMASLLVVNCQATLAQTSVKATSTNNAADAVSCKQFVQRFYNWYAKEMQDTNTVIVNKPGTFTPELTKLLKADTDAQAQVTGEIVGLDFDPILNTNSDPYSSYRADAVTKKGNGYLVTVYGVTSGKKTAQPIVTPEVVKDHGKWKFANFHFGKTEFPQNSNLISVLKALSSDRLKYKGKK